MIDVNTGVITMWGMIWQIVCRNPGVPPFSSLISSSQNVPFYFLLILYIYFGAVIVKMPRLPKVYSAPAYPITTQAVFGGGSRFERSCTYGTVLFFSENHLGTCPSLLVSVHISNGLSSSPNTRSSVDHGSL
jgi:hypothetical protein